MPVRFSNRLAAKPRVSYADWLEPDSHTAVSAEDADEPVSQQKQQSQQSQQSQEIRRSARLASKPH